VPGFFGSLAATPQQPGFSLATIYYHTSVSAGGNVAFARQVNLGHITANLTGNVAADLDARADLGFAIPSYVFATPVVKRPCSCWCRMDAARLLSMQHSPARWDRSVSQGWVTSVNR
jgi:hypothetical protein